MLKSKITINDNAIVKFFFQLFLFESLIEFHNLIDRKIKKGIITKKPKNILFKITIIKKIKEIISKAKANHSKKTFLFILFNIITYIKLHLSFRKILPYC